MSVMGSVFDAMQDCFADPDFRSVVNSHLRKNKTRARITETGCAVMIEQDLDANTTRVWVMSLDFTDRKKFAGDTRPVKGH